MATLTLELATAFMHDLLVIGQVIKPSRKLDPDPTSPNHTYNYMYGNPEKIRNNPAVMHAIGTNGENIKKAILDRECTINSFNKLANILIFFYNQQFIPSLRNYNAEPVSLKELNILPADCVALFCAYSKLYFDDVGALSLVEQQALHNSNLGQSLYKFGAFVSQQEDGMAPDISKYINGTSAATVSTSTASAQTQPAPAQQTTQQPQATAPQAQPSTTQSATATPSAQQTNTAAAKQGYKTSGPHSADVSILVGKPGDKITPTVTTLYCVIGDKEGASDTSAFITPLKVTKDGAASMLAKEKAGKIKFGSGRGYADCTCWFENKADAERLKDFCIKAFPDRTGIRLGMSTKIDKNGYFEVETEVGKCLIKANKLNEELLDDKLTEEQEIRKTGNIFSTKGSEVYFNSYGRD